MKDALLWKRVLNEGVRVGEENPEEFWDLQDRIVVAPIIIAPVTKAMGTDIAWDEYQGISIPFDTFWVEGTDTFVDYDGVEKPATWGALCMTERTEDGVWTLITFNVMGTPHNPPTFLGICSNKVSPEGQLLPATFGSFCSRNFADTDRPALEQSNSTNFSQVLDNLLLLGCKNVSLEKRDNEAKDAKRAAKRFGGDPDYYRYHVLVVRPAGGRSDAPSHEIGKMPRHVCRGHFSEYGPEFGKGLLFGKYAGRFYVPPHLKGKRENGVVEKDYALPGVREQG